ncbi:hypothetical protein QA612_01640 [Evansella sp. AB-P1]|uniref:hypothetical protein n=1 Tax=Evansella sp. AB-P1 TaxID=3037653 RepID=UPI00241CC6C4|nr:hypothetical protein [Evansella sp. AB-P1]MDG5786176.1 hypothetical protein [Evansella sp. AB-P1]
MIDIISLKSKVMFHGIARMISKSMYLDQLFNDCFYKLIAFFRFPSFRSRGKGRAWCELNQNLGRCNLPNNQYCSKECMEGVGLSTRCPQGYHPSHSWGYQVTGCWCDTFRGRSIVCCDCTPVTNSPYQPSSEDCGCMHFLNE